MDRMYRLITSIERVCVLFTHNLSKAIKNGENFLFEIFFD